MGDYYYYYYYCYYYYIITSSPKDVPVLVTSTVTVRASPGAGYGWLGR